MEATVGHKALIWCAMEGFLEVIFKLRPLKDEKLARLEALEM